MINSRAPRFAYMLASLARAWVIAAWLKTLGASTLLAAFPAVVVAQIPIVGGVVAWISLRNTHNTIAVATLVSFLPELLMVAVCAIAAFLASARGNSSSRGMDDSLAAMDALLQKRRDEIAKWPEFQVNRPLTTEEKRILDEVIRAENAMQIMERSAGISPEDTRGMTPEERVANMDAALKRQRRERESSKDVDARWKPPTS